MPKVCTTAKEFSDSMKNKEGEIYIEGDLKNHVFRIKAIGKVSWAVCAVSLAAAIAFYMATPKVIVVAPPAGAATATAGFTMSAVAAAALGSATVPAIAIGVCSGGVGALNALRDKYKIVEKTDKYIKLKRK